MKGSYFALAALAVGCGSTSPETIGSSHGALTVGGVSGCDTTIVDGLAKQLIAEQNCIQPNALVSFAGTPNVSIDNGVYAFLEPAAAAGLVAAAKQSFLHVTSGFRTLPEQFLLYGYYQNGECGITLAAAPGQSNHETGTAVDLGNYGAAYAAMTSNGWSHSYPSSDPVHYDFTAGGTVDLRSDSVLAFQKLWNLNNPNDPIAEDGSYGPATEARLSASPVGGFPLGSTCAAPPVVWPQMVHPSRADVDGDHRADVCARDSSGILCALSSGSGFGAPVNGPAWSDASGWASPQYDATIQFGDVTGDGKADVCGRAFDGVHCNVSTGHGFGPDVKGPPWSDASGWGSAQYYSTIQLADVDGDGKADLCARAAAGIGCVLASGDGSFAAAVDGPAWSDANGWAAPEFYSTIQFVDVNGDGKADVCARESDGIVCNLSDGEGFPTVVHGPAWSDASGWGAVQFGSTVRFVDVNGDGKADVCGRAASGIVCSLSDGTSFGPEFQGPAWSDANGWAKPEYYSTIQYADVDGDGKTDVCGRAASGVVCALSLGAGFGPPIQGPAWSDASGWAKPEYYSTIRAADLDGDGRADLCARDAAGITCALSTGEGFAPTFSGPAWSDANGWAGPQFFSTVRLLGGSKLVDLGGDGGAPPDGGDGGASPSGPSSATGCACGAAGATSSGRAPLAMLVALFAVVLGRARRSARR